MAIPSVSTASPPTDPLSDFDELVVNNDSPCRPYGTHLLMSYLPSVETLGYLLPSRHAGLVLRFATSRADRLLKFTNAVILSGGGLTLAAEVEGPLSLPYTFCAVGVCVAAARADRDTDRVLNAIAKC